MIGVPDNLIEPDTYSVPGGTVTNVTPFTYRDGMTFLELLERMRRWINGSLVPDTNKNFEAMIKAFEDSVKKITGDSQAAVDELIKAFADLRAAVARANLAPDSVTSAARGYTRSHVLSIGMNWPGRDFFKGLYGGHSIQTFFIHENELYVIYRAATAYAIVVRKWPSGEYLTYFVLPNKSAWPEGFIVKREGPHRNLYVKNSVTQPRVARFEITKMPDEGERLEAKQTYTVDIGNKMAQWGDGFTVVQSGDGGRFGHLDRDWTPIDEIRLSKVQWGYDFSSPLYGKGALKIQAFCDTGSSLVGGVGGHWRDGKPNDEHAMQGIVEVGYDGTVITRALMDPLKVVNLLNRYKIVASSIENEGMQCLDGVIYSGWVHRTWDDPDSLTNGFTIFREFDAGLLGIDMSECAKDHFTGDVDSYQTGLWPTSTDNYFYDRLSHKRLENTTQVFDMMYAQGLTRFAWYTWKNRAITSDTEGVRLPDYSLVTITRLSGGPSTGGSLIVNVIRNNGSEQSYFIQRRVEVNGNTKVYRYRRVSPDDRWQNMTLEPGVTQDERYPLQWKVSNGVLRLRGTVTSGPQPGTKVARIPIQDGTVYTTRAAQHAIGPARTNGSQLATWKLGGDNTLWFVGKTGADTDGATSKWLPVPTFGVEIGFTKEGSEAIPDNPDETLDPPDDQVTP